MEICVFLSFSLLGEEKREEKSEFLLAFLNPEKGKGSSSKFKRGKEKVMNEVYTKKNH